MNVFSRRALTAALVLAFSAPAMAATQLTGAGSSFVYPFFSKAFYEYNKKHGDVSVNYQSIGSGGGIQQFSDKNVDFGASDVPMNAKELARAGSEVIQIPVALGGESVIYNLPGTHNGIHVTRQLLVDIFMGKVTKWNDGAIAKLNRGTRLPDVPIVVVHRSDGSGTTYIFTDFLSHVSGEWHDKVGTGKSVSWPAPSSVGGKGNEGVAGLVRNTPGAIGYVELAYAKENHMDSAAILNRSNQYVNDSVETVRAAASTKPSISSTNFSIVDTPGRRSYPIAGYTWTMVYKQMKDGGRARLLHQILEYVVSDAGQRIAGSLDYVPLPANVQNTAHRLLAAMKL